MGTGRSGRVTDWLFEWIHAGGVGELADVGPDRWTGEKYVEVLEDITLPSVRAMLYPEPEPFYLLHDNNPIHTCRAVKAWFEQHPGITVVPHPPKSPDLNPIEHIWNVINKDISHNCHRSLNLPP